MLRFISYLLRWPRSHGFGIQSPADFKLATSVLAQPVPADVMTLLPDDYDRRELLVTVWRIASFLLPQHVCILSNDALTWQVVRLAAPDSVSSGIEQARLIVVDAAAGRVQDLGSIANDTYLIVANIRRSAVAKATYRAICNHPKATIIFDLHSHAVIHHHRQRFPERYALAPRTP